MKLENNINTFSFILAFFINVIFIVLFDLTSNKIAWFVGFIVIYLSLFPLFKKVFANRYLAKNKNLVSFIFYREYFGDKKFDIHKNFSEKEIEDFINRLDCEEFILKNKIPPEYSYRKNKDYTILSFEKAYLKHYTRVIPWEILSWKYSFYENDGVNEYLGIEYINENNETVKEEILTDRIEQKSSFHLFLLFIIYDLKYGKKLSLHRGFCTKQKSTFKIDLFE